MLNSPLFAEGHMGRVPLKNRLVRTATIESMVLDGRTLPDAYLALYRRLAKGGAGLIIAGNYFVAQNGMAQPNLVADRDEVIPELQKLTSLVRAENGVIFAQLNHGGRQADPAMIGCQPVAPSAVRDKVTLVKPRALSEDEVEALIEAYVSAARRMQEAGFAGVQINGAHGYLVNQFLSAYTNRRRDRFGGTLTQRARFLTEIFTRTRKVVGPDFPLAVKLNSQDNVRGGVTVGECVAVSVMLDALGVDAIEVSGGIVEAGLSTTRGEVPMDLIMQHRSFFGRLAVRLFERKLRRQCTFSEGYHRDATALVKAKVKTPVIAVGGLRTRAVMEATLTKRRADFIGMCRPFILQPNLAARLSQEPNFEVACSSCNRCTLTTVVHHEPLACRRHQGN